MKRTLLFGVGLGSAALLLAGQSFAAPPEGLGFNDWEATDGAITLRPNGAGGTNCAPPACVVLLNEVGMIQARVRANDDPLEEGFFHSVNVEDDYTGTAIGAVFANESFVSAENAFSLAVLNTVDLSGEGTMAVVIADGALRDADNNEASLIISQSNQLGGYGSADFWFERQSLGGVQFSTSTTSGSMLRIDQTVGNVTGNRGTPFTVRQTSGLYTADSGTLELVDGTSITYIEGDHIGTLFMTGLLWHGGPMHSTVNEQRAFEVQSIANFTTEEAANWSNINVAEAIDDTGVGYVNFIAVWADEFADNASLWNANFGDAPNAIPSGEAPSAALNGAGAFGPFPEFGP